MKRTYDAGKIQNLLNNSLKYKESIQLPQKVAENERFRLGDQWSAPTEKTKNFPRPVLNFCDNIITHKTASIQNENVKMVFTNEGDDELGKNFTRFADREAERLKFSDFNAGILDDSATKGVGISYHYIEGSPDGLVKMQNEKIDMCNFHVGDPKQVDVQKQPHIIVVQRLSIDDIQDIADANGVKTTIANDTEVLGQGYANKNIDIDGIEKANLINFFYRSREDGTIHIIKICDNEIIQPDMSLNIKKYPFVVLQWSNVTEFFYSKAEIDYLKPNQRQINALMGLLLMNVQLAGFPKMWGKEGSLNPRSIKNIPGEIIIDHSQNPGLQFGWLQPAPLDNSAMGLLQNLLEYSKNLNGAADVDTGTSASENATAIMLLQKKAGISLDKLKRKYYQYIEDTALIWLEFFCNFYIIDRQFTYIDELGNQRTTTFNARDIDVDSLNVKVDIGASSEYSEQFTITALDKFLSGNLITFKQYLKYVPDTVVPFKNSLLQEMDAQDKAKQQEAMEYIMGKLTPQEKELFSQLPPEAQNRFLLKKANEEEQLGMMQKGNVGQAMPQAQSNNQMM